MRVGLIGAGKFGTMFLSQVPTTKGLRVNVIADIYVDNAKQRCLDIGWGQDRVEATQFTDDAFAMINDGEIDIVVEATGNPVIGVVHAKAAIEAGLHVVMVNVEADVLAGTILARKAISSIAASIFQRLLNAVCPLLPPRQFPSGLQRLN